MNPLQTSLKPPETSIRNFYVFLQTSLKPLESSIGSFIGNLGITAPTLFAQVQKNKALWVGHPKKIIQNFMSLKIKKTFTPFTFGGPQNVHFGRFEAHLLHLLR